MLRPQEGLSSGRRLRGNERLKKRSEFLAVQNSGMSARGKHFVVACAANGRGYARLGIVASSRLGNAVLRSRLKRLVRETFRTNKDAFKEGYDWVIIARQLASQAAFEEARSEITGLARKLGERRCAG